MNIRRFSTVVILSGIFASVVLPSSAARAAEPAPISLSICSSASALAALANNTVDLSSPQALTTLRADTLNVVGSGTSAVTASGGRSTLSVSTPQQANKLCQARRPNDRNITPDGAIDGSSLIALKVAIEYRKLHPWPAIPAPIDSSATTLYLTSRGKYVLVSFIGDKTLYPGCEAEENYRVDPVTLAILPFDNCLEGHKALFPTLRQLPG